MATTTSNAGAARLVALAWDANDPLRLARFWADALGWEVAADAVGAPTGAIDLVPTDGTRFGIRFVPVPEPKAGKNPIHLDLTTATLDDQAGTVERLLAGGASHVDIGQGSDETHVVLADPEGNELCIIEPDNTFLAGCGRLGSITCDGSPQTGSFWSAVLGWPLVWDQDGETAIRHPDGTGPFITWGPPIPEKVAKNRLHLHIAPPGDAGAHAEIARLTSLGASTIDGAGADAARVLMADPDGNEFCLLPG